MEMFHKLTQNMDYTAQPSVTRVNPVNGSCTRFPLTPLDTNQASILTSPVARTASKTPPMAKTVATSNARNAPSPVRTTNKRPTATASPTHGQAANVINAQALTDYESLDLKRPQKKTLSPPLQATAGCENGISH
ncbi:hypothetical protein BGX26_011277 [Mortierella sp. AD094]|nr:hypothetical protein BGX26_011277 [Mortierella sp. AD094]